MSVISLLSDFGTDDEYVGVMKGVILCVNPDAKLIDITHCIEPQDLLQAGYLVQASYPYFPEGTIHMIVVDPGVGSQRAVLAVKTPKYIFLAPDNGILTLVLGTEKIIEIIRVENEDYFLKPVSQTFHGRDIFAPVAGHLSKGLALTELGPLMSKDELIQLPIPEPCFSDDNELVATIISVDRFGNLITNVDENLLQTLYQEGKEKHLEIWIGESNINGLSQSYASVNPQHPLAIIGSRGYLEISVNCGNAKSYFMVEKGDNIWVRI